MAGMCVYPVMNLNRGTHDTDTAITISQRAFCFCFSDSVCVHACIYVQRTLNIRFILFTDLK